MTFVQRPLPYSPNIDTTVSHSARLWDYWLGGQENYPVDRRLGDRIIQLLPDIVEQIKTTRVFSCRAVWFAAKEEEIDQFLDLGTGLPSPVGDDVHEVAQRVNPAARTVYVDNDPLVLAHARALLTSGPEGAVGHVDADLHEPERILAGAASVLDLARPVAITMTSVLWHILDDEAAQSIISTIMAAVPSGSLLAITHPTTEVTGEQMTDAIRHWNEHGTPQGCARTPAQIEGFFDGLELVDPGIVPCALWRRELEVFKDSPSDQLCGMGRKP